MTDIGFIGLGAMGERMASSLLDAGHSLTIWNRNPARAVALAKRGARLAADPREVARISSVVFSMVRDDHAARAVWLDPERGALAGLAPRAVAVECSTASLGAIEEISAAFARADRAFVAAPVVGSRPQADDRSLVFLAGGTETAIDAVEPLLLTMGMRVHRVGQTGASALAKLVVNALFGIQVAALAELIATLRRRGHETDRVWDAIATTAVVSPAAKAAAASMLAADFAPRFPVTLVEKDFGYAVAAAGGDASAPMTAAARAVFGRAIDDDIGDDNLTGVLRLYQTDALRP